MMRPSDVLDARFGGLFELAYLQNGEFQKLSKIVYIFVFVKDDAPPGISLISYAKYVDDALILKTIRPKSKSTFEASALVVYPVWKTGPNQSIAYYPWDFEYVVTIMNGNNDKRTRINVNYLGCGDERSTSPIAIEEQGGQLSIRLAPAFAEMVSSMRRRYDGGKFGV